MGRRLSQLCPPYATPSSNSSLDYRRSDARIVENGFAASSGVNKSAKVVLGRVLIKSRSVSNGWSMSALLSSHDVVDLPLRCQCGRMRGVASDVSPSTGFRVVCYCKDCQAFAHFLDRADVLDPAGGTDIFQMPPGRLKLTAGTDAMRCLRLSNKVLRWYSDCCRTPIANTAARPRF